MMVSLKPDNSFMDLIDYVYQLRLKHRDLFLDRKDENEYIENYTKTIAEELTNREEKLRVMESNMEHLEWLHNDAKSKIRELEQIIREMKK